MSNTAPACSENATFQSKNGVPGCSAQMKIVRA
jgi:hypothetical protein